MDIITNDSVSETLSEKRWVTDKGLIYMNVVMNDRVTEKVIPQEM